MSVKQDGARVRTAEQLELKYNLAGMKEAFEQSHNTVYTVNKILENFVNVIVGTLDNFEGLEDGKLITHFYSGTPTMETVPTSDWTDGKENHINDYYYDRDTGKAYIFAYHVSDIENEDGQYSWSEVTDKDKIQSLALANATVDATDNQRRIFLEQPIPPYDNGDLWLKDGVIYSCQISKPETESYEEHDFIVSSSYSGDTLAIKIGKELEVLKGTVLKVTQDAEVMRSELTNLDKNTSSSIEQLLTQIKTLIVDENGNSKMVIDGDSITFDISWFEKQINDNTNKVTELDEIVQDVEKTQGEMEKQVTTLEKRTVYIFTGVYDGKPCIELGVRADETEDAKDFKLIITNQEILFFEGSNLPASISHDAFNAQKVIVEISCSIAGLEIVKRGNGHISFMPKGVM